MMSPTLLQNATFNPRREQHDRITDAANFKRLHGLEGEPSPGPKQTTNVAKNSFTSTGQRAKMPASHGSTKQSINPNTFVPAAKQTVLNVVDLSNEEDGEKEPQKTAASSPKAD